MDASIVTPETESPESSARAAQPDDGAVFRDQGGQSGLPPVLPDGRLLRAVLRRRGSGEPGARHRADQARQARRRGHPHVRRADRARRRLPEPPDRARPSRGGLRAARGPGGREEARREVGGEARRGAPRHPRDDHRGAAAGARSGAPPRRRAAGQGRRRPLVLRPRRARPFDRRLLPLGDGRGGARRRDRPARAVRNRRRGVGLGRAVLCAPRRRASRAPDPAGARRRRRRRRRPPGLRILWRRDARRFRRLLARRDLRGGAGARLCPAHAVRRAAGPLAADPPRARREPRDRPGDPPEPRTDPDARRRPGGLAARDDRPDGRRPPARGSSPSGWRAR